MVTRNEIIDTCKLSSGGTTTLILEELQESGFIAGYVPFGKTSKESIYKLSDEYSIFYLKFIEGSKATGAGTWLRQINATSYKSWSGFAFEAVCQKHIDQIKKTLVLPELWWKIQDGGTSLKKGAERKERRLICC